jgi:hypothetical protein
MASQLKFSSGMNLFGALWKALEGLISDSLRFYTIV